MVKFKVLKVKGIEYTLQNLQSGERETIALSFFDLESPVLAGDVLSFHKELLDKNYEEYSSHYYFGGINEVYGREIKSAESKDVLAIIKEDKTILLKRFFG